jgi:threonine/homoserine/homoserine lactone efflux protein
VHPALTAAGLGFSAAASPGPFQAVLLERAARVGPARALPLALVPLVSDPPIVGASVLALSGLPGGFLRVVALVGGALLVWMGASALRDLGRPAPPTPAGEAPRFGRAVLVNLLNPNAWLFWSLVGGPLLIESWRDGAGRALAFLAGFYLLLTGTNAALILLFGAAGRLGPRVSRALAGLSGAALLALGLWQLWRGAAG